MLSQNTHTYREANLQSLISFYFLFSPVVWQRTVSPERADWVWVYISEIIKTDIWTRGCLYHSLCLYSHQTCTSSGSNSKLYFRIAQACPLKKFKMKTGIKPRLKPLIFFFLSCILPLVHLFLFLSGEFWQSVRDSATTVDLSYLQAQRHRFRRDSDSEAVNAIASLSMRSLTSER